jgi:hypothetical protein
MLYALSMLAVLGLALCGALAGRGGRRAAAAEFDLYDATDADGQALLASIDRLAARQRAGRKYAEPTAIPLRNVPTRAAR